MQIFNSKHRFNAFVAIMVMSILVSCKKEKATSYGVTDQDVYGTNIDKNKKKSETEYIAILSTNLFQKPLSVNELVKTQHVIQSVGDKALVSEIIISNYMNSPDVILPSNASMRADLDKFINDLYKRFYVRFPTELERAWFKNYLQANPNVTPELIYTSFAASDEYLFY